MELLLILIVSLILGGVGMYIRNSFLDNKKPVDGKPSSGWTGIPKDEPEDPSVIKKEE